MEIKEQKPKEHVYLKRKLLAALSMLLVSTLLMTTTTYAWLVMAVAPEVSGISTNIGANGSLEIALLNTSTRQDLSKITSIIGESLASRNASANNTWGNLVDLGYTDYGMDNITLLPTRLNVTEKAGGEGYVVDSGLLAIPTYGFDGRIMELSEDTISAVYDKSEFSYILGTQDYGVRAIGTTDSLSVQGAALALAKSNIKTYTKSAKSAAEAAFESNGNTLMNIVIQHATTPSLDYDDADRDGLKAMVNGLQSSLDYIDLALRQGIIALAASELGNEDVFLQVRDRVSDTTTSLMDLMEQLSELSSIPQEYETWVTNLADVQNNLNAAKNACESLTDGSYTWDELKAAMDPLMNTDYVYLNDQKLSEFGKEDAGDLMGGNLELLLAPGSGVPASIADYVGDLEVWLEYMGSIYVTTATDKKPPYLTALSEKIKDLEAADGSTEGESEIALTSTYGYAIDLAFRCNAMNSNLLLQTTPEQRVYSESVSASTMGGGSYMEFTSKDADFTVEQMVTLMDAVRVGFIDDQGNLLGVAKLNISNRTIDGRMVKAPLYLYAYEFSEEDGSMVMGERQKTNNVITSLDQNVAKALTAVVWLDGDLVDNTMVSATESLSLSGVLNLQFASSARLIPASDGALLNMTADKTALKEAIELDAEHFAAGQGTYTTVSWDAYADAYTYAVAINNNENANDTQIYNAAMNLAKTKAKLEEVSHEALKDKISEMRTFMGETEDVARIVLKDAATGDYYCVDPVTHEQYDNKVGEVHRVDYENNLQDEGNDVKTPIYTDESWSALAAALYAAEVVDMDAKATDAEINDAITAMEASYEALQRRVFYLAYDYNGSLYYFAISEETDTYGKWYDSDFKRIFSERLIIELDAHAELADIAVIEQDEYIANNPKFITPYIDILSDVYTELSEEEIIALQWNVPELFNAAITQDQITALTELTARGKELGVDAALTQKAETILEKGGMETASEAESVIAELKAAVQAAEDELAAANPETPTEDNSMTASQRTVLTEAISRAESVEDYDDTTKTELDALRSAVTDANAVLVKADATKEEAQAALDTLNAQLTANGLKEVTEYNTITYPIPVGSEIKEVVYAVQSATGILYLTGDTGVTTIEAVILTKNGVVYTASKNVNIYAPAGGAKISEPTELPTGGSQVETEVDGEKALVWDKKIEAGATMDLSAVLFNREVEKTDEAGNTVMEEIIHGETIKKYTWASSDSDVIAITNSNSAAGTLNAKKAGTATISVSINTTQGNTYAVGIIIEVTGAAAVNP